MSSGGLYCCNCVAGMPVCWGDLDSQRLSLVPILAVIGRPVIDYKHQSHPQLWFSDDEESEGQGGELLSRVSE